MAEPLRSAPALAPPLRRTLILLAALAVAAAPVGCGREAPPAGGGEVLLTISAAASLKDALEEIAPAFEAAHPGVGLRLNLASSGTLQRQIERGAPVDVFISAAPQQMDALEEAGAILPETRRDIAANDLVLVVPGGGGSEIRSFGDLLNPAVRRVAVGAPASVPAGRYAEQVLHSLGIAEDVLAKAVRAQHVRQVLSYVELGEVDAGIVYRTEAAGSRRARVVASAPAGSHAAIVYPAAVVRGTSHPEEAREFVAFLSGARAQAVLQRMGFRPSSATPAPPPE